MYIYLLTTLSRYQQIPTYCMLLWCSNDDMVVHLMGLCDANVSLWDGQFDCLVDVCLTILAWNLNCDLLLVRNLSSKCFIPHICGWLCCVALSRGQVAFTSKALCEEGLCIFSKRNSKSIVASDAMHPGGMAIPAWWGMRCIPRGRQSHSGDVILFWRYDNAGACLSWPRWQRECLEWHEISATTGGCDSRPRWRE